MLCRPSYNCNTMPPRQQTNASLQLHTTDKSPRLLPTTVLMYETGLAVIPGLRSIATRNNLRVALSLLDSTPLDLTPLDLTRLDNSNYDVVEYHFNLCHRYYLLLCLPLTPPLASCLPSQHKTREVHPRHGPRLLLTFFRPRLSMDSSRFLPMMFHTTRAFA